MDCTRFGWKIFVAVNTISVEVLRSLFLSSTKHTSSRYQFVGPVIEEGVQLTCAMYFTLLNVK